MKALIKNKLKFYKYQYKNFTRPNITSNGTMNGSSFACTQSNLYEKEYACLAFDGSNTTQWTNNGNTGFMTFYNPNPLNITKLTVMNGCTSGYVRPISSGELLGSNDGTNFTSIKTFTNSVTGLKATWDIDLSSNKNYYKYHKLSVKGDGSYARITELNITAQERTVIESTIDDYDYCELYNTYNLCKDNNKLTYYKWTNWTQPTLTSNGTLGVSTLACYAYRSYNSAWVDCYSAFSPNTGYIGAYKSLASSTLYIYFYSKNYLKISNFSFHVPIKNTNNDASGGYAKALTLYGYNPQTRGWEQLAYIAGGSSMGNKTHTMNLSNNTKYYKYYRFQGTTGGGGHMDEIDISNIKITAQQAVVSNSTDYDFIEESLSYKACI